MQKITFFGVPFDKLILRFYLIMAIVIGSFFIGMPGLALLAVPLFFSTLLGISIKKNHEENKVVNLSPVDTQSSDLEQAA